MPDLTGPQFSGRGFKFFDPIPAAYSNTIRVYESSAAMRPCLWVAIEHSERHASAHLTLESAALLRDQLTYLIEHHYQIEDVDA